MRHKFQLATVALLLTAVPGIRAQLHLKRDKPAVEDLSWMWQYTQPAPGGNGNGLINDPRLLPFLKLHLTAPQAFWGNKPLADTALEFLGAPGVTRADENRYITATGCVPHFCPDRGMLFVDTAGSRPLVIFAALDWSREGRATDEANAEYTLWIFADRVLASADSPDNAPRLPSSLQRSLRIFSAELNGSKLPPLVTRSFIVDPDGKPHEIAPSQTGVTRFHDSQPLATAPLGPQS
jgi:hypothetical protein